MASLSLSNMRCAIIGVYPGLNWIRKVNKMSDSQVIAIYHKFSRDGYFEHPRTGRKKEDPNFRQMNLFDDFGIEKVYPKLKGVSSK